MTSDMEPSKSTVAPSNGQKSILELDRISGGYGAVTVLRDVSMRLAPSSVTALVGPNGAGKTTLLRVISGTIPAASGCVRLNGQDVTRLKPHQRAKRGLIQIPEGRGIYRTLTVRENLEMQAVPGRERDAVDRAAEVFPVLGKRLTQRAGTMSGGEQQMLSLAAAYIRSPEIVLVDEPSLGLAPIIVNQIFSFLEELASRGAALLLVDQFAMRVLQMATSAYVLRRGSIVYEGSPAALLEGNMFEHYLGSAEV